MSIEDFAKDEFTRHVVNFYYTEVANSIKSKEEYKTILVPHLGKFVYNHRRRYKINEKRLKGVE